MSQGDVFIQSKYDIFRVALLATHIQGVSEIRTTSQENQTLAYCSTENFTLAFEMEDYICEEAILMFFSKKLKRKIFSGTRRTIHA
ncbi:hypothetical protein WN51_04673 [Melipona quadrifasciata]|uniref:Uncharacterized protein n=1 Tax=Melipona quadrifasciata TaxID=166423 RepID=A0A0N0BDZ7_9HYME|nr:hypothetical protein WN51_04673 [Melipona quadrifasciata]